MRISRMPLVFLGLTDCGQPAPPPSAEETAAPAASTYLEESPRDLRARAFREGLVRSLEARGDVTDPAVLDVLRRVPRHAFAPDVPLQRIYEDRPAPIGYDQTISQPTIVGI